MKLLLAVAVCLYVAGCGKPEGIETCEVCGGDVSIKADVCPHCGEKNPSPTAKARIESERKESLKEAELEAAQLRLAGEQERAKPLKETLAAMDEVRGRLTQYAEEHKRNPDDDTARKFAFETKDAWGFGFQFEYIDAKAGKYRLRSTGDELITREFVIGRQTP